MEIRKVESENSRDIASTLQTAKMDSLEKIVNGYTPGNSAT